MTFEDRFRAALLTYIQQGVDQLAIEVTDWDDDSNDGGCDTCGYGAIRFRVYYSAQDYDKGSRDKQWSYDGGLGSLIRELTEDDE